MKAFTFKNTGEEGDINHVGEEAVIFEDSDVGEPDEGNSNEGDGGPHIDNIADEIGEPAKESVDVVAGEPTVAEKDDEFGAFVGEPVEEESSNSMQALEKENSIESSEVTDNADRSVNGEEILKANDKPVEDDSSNSMQEFERETSNESLKVTYNEEKIPKGCGEPVEEDNNQSMQEVEEDISNEGVKVTDYKCCLVNEEEFPKACGEPVKEDSSNSMQEVKEEISAEPLTVMANEECSVNDEEVPKANKEAFPKACGEPVKEDNDQSMQEVEEDISNEGLTVMANEECSVKDKEVPKANEEAFPKACGEPVKEDNDQSMQEVKEEISAEPLTVMANEECSVNDEEVPKANEENIQCALADIISKINTKSEVPKTCISDTKALSNVKSSCALKKRKRKTQFKSSSYEEKSKVGDVKSPEGRRLNRHGDDNGSDGGGIGGTRTPEGYMPDIHGDGVGTDGVEEECLRTSSVKRKCFPFGFHLKIELLLMVKIWVMVNVATGATIPPQSYQCCTFESVVSKISNFSIKLGTEDICNYNSYAKLINCTKGSLCFITNDYNVKFCDKTNNVEALIMEYGQNRTIINSSDQEELSDEQVAIWQKYYGNNSRTTTVTPFPTTPSKMPETGVHFSTIVTAVIILTLGILCVFTCRYLVTRSTPIS
ncbi:uncharacterized protein LOC120916285 isoform X2 [Rana temporaria]|nr:uncharacterized protein LOC120916285 isoform X2 [Rana temporaria]